MIDTLMMAYTVEAVSVEKVMACICQYPSCYPEVETPYDTEDAVTTWINKVSYGTQCFLKTCYREIEMTVFVPGILYLAKKVFGPQD